MSNTQIAQSRHYAAVRARLWPVQRRARPEVVLSPALPPKPEWSTPIVVPLYATLDDRIAAIMLELGRRSRVTTPTIIAITADIFGVPPTLLTARNRNHLAILPRHIAMTVASVVLAGKPSGSAPQIGSVFRRDPTTVLSAVGKFGEQVARVAAGALSGG